MNPNTKEILDLITVSEKSRTATSDDKLIDMSEVIATVHSLFFKGSDIVSVEVKCDYIFINGLSKGVLVKKPFCGKVSNEISLDSLLGLDMAMFDVVVSFFSSGLALIQSKEYFLKMSSEFTGNKNVHNLFNNSSGSLFVNSRQSLLSMSYLSVVNALQYGSDVNITFDGTDYVCNFYRKEYKTKSKDELVGFILSMSFKSVCIVNLSYSECCYLSCKLSCLGVFVLSCVVSQSSVHLYHYQLMNFEVSQFSSYFIGIVGVSEIPTYKPEKLRRIPFKDVYSFDYYNKIDSSPMPEDLILVVGDDAIPCSSSIISDFIAKPVNPSSLINDSYTVLDVYSALRLSKWESLLDKSMPLIKENKTGLDTIDKVVGKY